MRPRTLCLLSLAVMVAVASFSRDMQAQGVRIEGEISLGMGRLDQESDPPESISFEVTGEAELKFLAGQGAFSALVEIGIAESSQTENALDTAEFELRWEITQSLKLRASARSIGIESAEGNIKVINAPSDPVGGEKAVIEFDEIGLVNLEYTAGAYTVGIALSDACVPDCGYGRYADAAGESSNIAADRETSTGVLHLRGETEALSFNAYAASSRGAYYSSANESLHQGRGHGAGLGVSYRAGSLSLGFDASQATVKCMPEAVDKDDGAAALPSPCGDDREISQAGAKVAIGGFGLHYYLGREKAGALREEVANLDLVYIFQIEETKLSVEYRTVTSEETLDSTAVAATDSVFLLGVSFEF